VEEAFGTCACWMLRLCKCFEIVLVALSCQLLYFCDAYNKRTEHGILF
jgi:hypothetical protein